MKAYIKITGETQRAFAIQQLREVPIEPLHEVIIREKKKIRSDLQNDKMWPTLRDIAQQVEWYGHKIFEEDWKTIFTAALKKQRVLPGLDGGFVVCGESTSKMSVKEISDIIELATAFGTQHQVKWKDPTFEEL